MSIREGFMVECDNEPENCSGSYYIDDEDGGGHYQCNKFFSNVVNAIQEGWYIRNPAFALDLEEVLCPKCHKKSKKD